MDGFQALSRIGTIFMEDSTTCSLLGSWEETQYEGPLKEAEYLGLWHFQ